MASTRRSDLFLEISQSLVDSESTDLLNYVDSTKLLPARDLQHMDPHQIFIKLEHKKKFPTGDLSLLEDLMRKIGRDDFAVEARQIAEEEKKSGGDKTMDTSGSSGDEVQVSSAKRPRLPQPSKGDTDLMAQGKIMDGPIQLTSTRLVNNRKLIVLTPEAERILSSLPPRSVDVVAVVGPMRKGKSQMSNLLCKRKSGFPLGDTLDSTTKGFWFWIGPHPSQAGRYHMVIDTEGLGDCADEEQNEKDIKHLVLANLMSNHLVFNLQGNPGQGFVSQLRLMGDLAEHVRVQADGRDGGNDLGKHLPELWVTVQDATLKLPERNGRRLTPDEYLEDMLKRKDGFTKAIRAHNDMTDAVKNFFPKRHLRLIPPPSIDSDVLSKLDKVNDCVLEPKYKNAVGNVIQEVWNSGLVKKVNGDVIKTTGLLHILGYYIKAINDPNAMPSVLGAHEAMVEGECRRALEAHMQQFKETVNKTVKPLMPTDEGICNRNISAALESAVSNMSAEVKQWDKQGAWKRRLQENLETDRRALLQLNRSKSRELCDEIIQQADRSVRQNVGRGVYNRIGGFSAYKRDMEAVYNTYKERAAGKGPAVDSVLQSFCTSKSTRGDTIKDTEQKLIAEDRRVKEEQRKKEEAKAAAARAAENERIARAEAAREAEAKRRAEAERAAEAAKRRAAEEEAKRRAAEAEAARQAQRAAEERARRKRKRSFLGIRY